MLGIDIPRAHKFNSKKKKFDSNINEDKLYDINSEFFSYSIFYFCFLIFLTEEWSGKVKISFSTLDSRIKIWTCKHEQQNTLNRRTPAKRTKIVKTKKESNLTRPKIFTM